MLRLGILGAGYFAEAHLEALRRLGDRVRLVQVARRRAAEPFPLAEALGVQPVAIDDLIHSSDVDAVSICLPNGLHARYVEAALRVGKHVFCEKPLTLTVSEADVVIQAAEASGPVLMVGHLTRHHSLYQKVGEIIQEGRLGEPTIFHASRLQAGGAAAWRMDPAMGGGGPFDLLIHDFDLLNWYLGRPNAVTARGRRHPGGAYEYLAATFSYANGTVAVVDGGFVLPPGVPFRAQLRIVGTQGVLEADTRNTAHPVRMQVLDQSEELPPVAMEGARINAITSEYETFLDSIEGKTPWRALLADARTAVECAERAVLSADRAETVTFAS